MWLLSFGFSVEETDATSLLCMWQNQVAFQDSSTKSRYVD